MLTLSPHKIMCVLADTTKFFTINSIYEIKLRNSEYIQRV